jgi:hypothetical protein
MKQTTGGDRRLLVRTSTVARTSNLRSSPILKPVGAAVALARHHHL